MQGSPRVGAAADAPERCRVLLSCAHARDPHTIASTRGISPGLATGRLLHHEMGRAPLRDV
jgi:hypothetical protein